MPDWPVSGRKTWKFRVPGRCYPYVHLVAEDAHLSLAGAAAAHGQLGGKVEKMPLALQAKYNIWCTPGWQYLCCRCSRCGLGEILTTEQLKVYEPKFGLAAALPVAGQKESSAC